MEKKITKATLGRIPLYLAYVKSLPETTTILSSTSMSRALGLGEVQVRKDLGQVSKSGKPKVGYKIEELIDAFEEILGVKEKTKAVVVGAGKLGRALIDNDGFESFGVEIIAGFDAAVTSPKSVGKIKIYPVDELKKIIDDNSVTIGIITVPRTEAKHVANELVSLGVKGIWNFAQINLDLPDGVELQQENLALSLAHLRIKIRNK